MSAAASTALVLVTSKQLLGKKTRTARQNLYYKWISCALPQFPKVLNEIIAEFFNLYQVEWESSWGSRIEKKNDDQDCIFELGSFRFGTILAKWPLKNSVKCWTVYASNINYEFFSPDFCCGVAYRFLPEDSSCNNALATFNLIVKKVGFMFNSDYGLFSVIFDGIRHDYLVSFPITEYHPCIWYTPFATATIHSGILPQYFSVVRSKPISDPPTALCYKFML